MSSKDPQVGFSFRLLHPDGRQETFLVDAERALVGSATHCEVRLPPEIAAHEHMEVVANERVVHFSVRPAGLALRAPVLDGAATASGRWAKGSVLVLGGVQMTVDVVELSAPRARPPLWALLVVAPMLAITIAAVAFAMPKGGGDPPIPPAPQILPAKDAAACPNVAPDQRAPLAAEKNRIALAKRERSPFSPRDGLEAIAYFDSAAICYRNAGLSSEAAQADQAAQALRSKLDEDYRIRRVRLEHAYRIHDLPAIKRELVVLRPMMAQNRGPYTEWMAAVDRAVTAELDERGRLQ